MTHDELFNAISSVITGQPIDAVIPILITASARALSDEADGNIDKLSTLLLRFCRLVENEAADMMDAK